MIQNNNKTIYFDCASTVKTNTDVIDTFIKVNEEYFANPASNHKLGAQANELLQKARKQISSYLDVLPSEIIFTSSATESNNIAIDGVCTRNIKRGNKIITTKAEHPSVLEAFKQKEKEGFDVHYLDYSKEGILNLEQLEKLLDDKTILVSIMKVNNETGYIFNTEEAFKIIKKKSSAYLHIDATQAIAKENLDSKYYDLLSFSAHKIAGIKGVGVLVKKDNVLLNPLFYGGGQENGLRSSTVSTPLCCSLATAIRIAFKTLPVRRENVIKLNNFLRDELSKIDEVEIISSLSSTPFILSFALNKHKASVISEYLSNNNIFVSTKSACSSREKGYSYVVKNAGYNETIASNAIRLSFAGYESIEEGKTFISYLKNALETIKE